MFEEGDTLLAVIQKSFFYNKIKVASNSNKGAKKLDKKRTGIAACITNVKRICCHYRSCSDHGHWNLCF